MALQPAVSIAWWLDSVGPADLLEQESLNIVVAGAGRTECADSGRWLSFIPWLVGCPHLKLSVTIVGDELVSDGNGAQSSRKLSDAQLSKRHESPFKAGVVSCAPATVFNGTYGEWLAASGAGAEIDLVILFAPGFTAHAKTWLTETELLPTIGAQVPIAVFGYSILDSLEDQHFLRLVGIDLEPSQPIKNPLVLEHELSDVVGSFGGTGWVLRTRTQDTKVDLKNPAALDFLELQSYTLEDAERYGADRAIERLGARVPVTIPPKGENDAIILLSHDYGFMESTGLLGEFHEDGFSVFSDSVVVPVELRENRPTDDVVARSVWALRIYRDFVEPWLDEDDDEDDEPQDDEGSFAKLFGHEMPEELLKFFQGENGEQLDPEDIADLMRAQGIAHGPMHPAWFDLLSSIGWAPEEYKENPQRYEAAFKVRAPGHGVTLPVITERYMFIPDDEDDKLAQGAMSKVSAAYPEGALLLFMGAPYLDVEGERYSFGGMLWWKGSWSPYALNASMKSPDEVIAQIEGGFTFSNVDSKYADIDSHLAVPFNRMCYGRDPNEACEMNGIGTVSGWIALLPE